MKIGIHDSDKTGFPNLALMKISAWHKAQGDTVEWWTPMFQFDRVYSSKVFTFTPECAYLPPDTIKGGTGYGIYEELPEEIDAMYPDYSIYPNCDHAIGFLTRGCIRNCPWCVVPKKEGEIRKSRTWQEIKRQDSRDIVFMDNNVLACEHGIEQMKSMVGQNVRIDFNQGLDARLITPEIAWEISVASAAPRMPILKGPMNRRSRPIFKTLVRIRKYSGVLLSPSARMIPATILYKKMNGMLAKIQPI